MKPNKIISLVMSLLIFGVFGQATAQIPSGVYHFQEQIESKKVLHELKIDDNYLIYTVYEKVPAKFIKTLGGLYKSEGGTLKVSLEFNSDFEKDGSRTLEIPFIMEKQQLVWHQDQKLRFSPSEKLDQDLDGQWLFATRGPDEGQERRGDENPRKTLKFLKEGYFQWIAYNTETMAFSGTGGGRYSSKDGVYTEIIDFFSRDNARVGASLEFTYRLEDNDWHHTGKNSKGEPMYEIWARR